MMAETDTNAQTEQHTFGAEVGRLLDLVVHSLCANWSPMPPTPWTAGASRR